MTHELTVEIEGGPLSVGYLLIVSLMGRIRIFEGESEPELKFTATPRELAVLRLASMGKSQEEIARIMGITFNTVNTLMGRLQRKNSYKTTTELVGEALKYDLFARPFMPLVASQRNLLRNQVLSKSLKSQNARKL